MGSRGYEFDRRISRSSILSDYHRDGNEEGYFQYPDESGQLVGQAKALVLVERLVDRIISTHSPAYEIRLNEANEWVAVETALGSRLRKCIPYAGMFDSFHSYTEQPLAFLDACWLMSSVYGIDPAGIMQFQQQMPVRQAEAMNDIVAKIRMSAKEYWFRRGPSDRRYESECRAAVLADYTRDILKYFARTLIVRLDGGYRKESRGFLTIDDVYLHLDHLLYLKDWHPAFYGLVGYAWAIEQGERDGFHLHLAFYFDGSKVCWDVKKGFELGSLWQNDITNGMGTFENCNAHKDRYGDKLGIGMISRSSPEECENAISCIQYLSKGGRFLSRDDQFLRIKPKGRHIFGTGYAPDIEFKRGRPAFTHAPITG